MACHDFSVPNIQNFLLPFRNYSTDTSVWDMLMPYIQCIKYSIFKICLGRTFNPLMKLHKQISDSLDSLCFKLHLSVGLQIIEIFFRAPVRLRWYPPPPPPYNFHSQIWQHKWQMYVCILYYILYEKTWK